MSLKDELMNDLIRVELLIGDLDKPDRKEGLRKKLQEMIEKI